MNDGRFDVDCEMQDAASSTRTKPNPSVSAGPRDFCQAARSLRLALSTSCGRGVSVFAILFRSR